HGLYRDLVVAANGKVVLCFALARTFEDQGRDSARQKWRLVGISFFFCRVEPDRHDQNRRSFDTGRLAQDAGQSAALVGNLDALTRRSQGRKCSLPTFDLLLVRGFHLRLMVHEQEGSKMIVDTGALQAFSRGEETFFRQRLTAQLLMMCRARRPGAAPLLVGGNGTGNLLEVGQDYAVGHKAGSPMGDSGL